MTSSTENIRMGTCRVIYDGTDLGFTSGGVEVTVATTTHETKVDQFGDTVANEYVMGRTISVKAPLVETTLENMAKIIPGAVLTGDGVKATGSITFSGQPSANDTITVGGVVFTFKASAVLDTDLVIGANLAATLAAAAIKIDAKIALVTVSASATVLTITGAQQGAEANSVTLAKSGTTATVSGATLTGGVDATKRKVSVSSGTGISLLSVAKELVLHPIAKDTNDTSEDLVIPLAATAGAMNFAYKYDAERVFDCEFKGYPNAATGVLFIYGDKTVV
jgi:hypothetical protein